MYFACSKTDRAAFRVRGDFRERQYQSMESDHGLVHLEQFPTTDGTF